MDCSDEICMQALMNNLLKIGRPKSLSKGQKNRTTFEHIVHDNIENLDQYIQYT